MDAPGDVLSSSSHLGSSLGSISPPRKSSEWSRRYKRASNLFLTRQLPEALATILPFVTVTPLDKHAEDQSEEDNTIIAQAPIAKADRKWRIKIWSFYLTLLNAIADLGPDDGKDAFGSKEWRRLITKAEDGTIWDHVVQVGYGGNEGSVDDDVVVNLATLLLEQSPTQATNQQYLESFLATSHFSDVHNQQSLDGANDRGPSQKSRRNGTDTPEDLETRIQVMEIYALHVLPRNGEWEYAKDYIQNSDVLDEERRDCYFNALQDLEEDAVAEDMHGDSPPQQGMDDVNRSASLDSITTETTIRAATSASHHRSKSEKDYGIEHTKPDSGNTTASPPITKSISKPAPKTQPISKPTPGRSPPKSARTSAYKRSAAIVASLQHVMKNLTQYISHNPTSLLQFILFLVGIVMTFSRRDVQYRVAKLTGTGWEKVKQTVGMGVKVSYI